MTELETNDHEIKRLVKETQERVRRIREAQDREQ